MKPRRLPCPPDLSRQLGVLQPMGNDQAPAGFAGMTQGRLRPDITSHARTNAIRTDHQRTVVDSAVAQGHAFVVESVEDLHDGDPDPNARLIQPLQQRRMQFVALQRQAAAGIPTQTGRHRHQHRTVVGVYVDPGQRHATAEQPVEIQGAGQRRQRIARQGDAGTDGPDLAGPLDQQPVDACLGEFARQRQAGDPGPLDKNGHPLLLSSGIRRDFARSRQACPRR